MDLRGTGREGRDMDPVTREWQLLPWYVPFLREGCWAWMWRVGRRCNHGMGDQAAWTEVPVPHLWPCPRHRPWPSHLPVASGSWHRPEVPQGMHSASPPMFPIPAPTVYLSCYPDPPAHTEVDQHSAVQQPVGSLPRLNPWQL